MSYNSEQYSRFGSYFTETNAWRDLWDPQVHVHTTEEMILLTENGSCTVINNGTTLHITTPALIWNRLGSFHNVSQVANPDGGFAFSFQPHILSQLPKRLLPLDFLENDSLFVLPLDLMQTSRFRTFFEAGFGSSFFQRPLLLSCIFHQISQAINSGLEPIRVKSVDNYIFQVISLLLSSGSPKLTVKELADQFHVGQTKLKADFKRITCVPIHTFRLQHQLRSARAKMAHNDVSLAQIAYECGFSDESHLVRSFKAEYGITPGAFRKKYINELRKAGHQSGYRPL